uniref:Putative secreted protein n=1 Tax=Anopheles darlingi TaxID=43151 RepID=A0A2M4D0G0_ANODA
MMRTLLVVVLFYDPAEYEEPGWMDGWMDFRYPVRSWPQNFQQKPPFPVLTYRERKQTPGLSLTSFST